MDKYNMVLVVTNPMIATNKSAEVTISKFLRVIGSAFNSVTVIGGNMSVEQDLKHIELCSFRIKRAESKLRRILDVLLVQLKMTGSVLRRAKKNQPLFFWIADKMILPYWAAKIKGAEVNYFIYGNVAKEGTTSMFTKISSKMIRYMAAHATFVCVESRSVINEWPRVKYKKLRSIHLYINDIEMNPIKNREKIFGMVCRLTAGKHVLECIEAMSIVHTQYPEWKLEIIGSGKQEDACKQLITKLKAEDYIKLLGWIEHDEVINKSEKWKYLLFPTDTEGMPNGLIEMMGRGIPALASPVGGVADIIYDQINGFVLRDTSVKTIAEKMIETIAIEDNQYRDISIKSFQIIRDEFTLDVAKKNAYEVLTE